MKKIALMIAGIGIAATAIPANAQAGWQGMNVRKAQIERQIDQGIRNGQLNRSEATRLRNEFRSLETLETRYRRSAPGLTAAERNDLDRRYNALAAKVRFERRDNDRPGAGNNWWAMQERKVTLDRRIDQGIRSGQLSRAEATRLRNEFNAIVRLEQNYRRSAPGLTTAEQRDLDRRFEALARKIRWERRDWERRR